MERNPISIFIADDHPIFRKGLEEVIAKETHFNVVGNAGDGESALEGIRRLLPMIAIVDIEMPKMNGLDMIRRVHEEELPVECIVLTMYQEEVVFDQAMELGVRGYLIKDSAIADILKAIDAVSQGDYFISPSLSSQSLKSHPAVQQNHDHRLGIDRLTAMEGQILSLIATSKSSKQIAEQLHVSVRTVDNHRFNIASKLGLHGNYSLLRFALDNKAWLT